MKCEEIFEEFISKTAINRELIEDYRSCCEIYGVPKIPNAIVAMLKNGAELIYKHKPGT